MPLSKAWRRTSRWVSNGLSSPKLYQSPSDSGGSSSPELADAAILEALVPVLRRDVRAVGLGHGLGVVRLVAHTPTLATGPHRREALSAGG